MSSQSSSSIRSNRSTTTRILLCLLLPCALGSLSACNILIPVSYAIDGQGEVEAEHELEPIKTLVFVDDSLNILPRQVLKVRLAEAISNDLVTRELIPKAVNPGDAMAMVRSRDRSGQHMSMQSIAREAGVKQLLFIEVESFESTVRNTQMRPNASCSLRVMHFDKGGRVYPETTMNVGGNVGDRVVEVQLREVAPEKAFSPSDRRKVEQELIGKMAVSIVKLFRSYDRLELGENLGVR
ncbi:MAG: hypothetical protein CBC49_000550 [Alphaproteobacteria bacterium TMED89]|nr:MAG: hypothetical protein CBC49_000550 [Alphaproteobacteria bacterium TMED89]